MKTLIIIGVVIAVVVVLVGGLAVWRIWATYRGAGEVYVGLASRIDVVEKSLVEGRDPAPADLERFARDRETRRVLYDALEEHKKLALFPAQYRTREALAEADLVLWLAHPNELGATPDEIELTKVVPAPAKEFAGQDYCLFRFRMKPPHWAAKDGWLAGLAGPYADGEASAAASGTFSRFEGYDSRTPEEHVRVTHELIFERK